MIMAIRSARPKARVRSWVTTIEVAWVRFFNLKISSSMVTAMGGSSSPVGSSNKNNCGSTTRARAMATRFCMPPESSLGERSSSPSSRRPRASRPRCASISSGGLSGVRSNIGRRFRPPSRKSATRRIGTPWPCEICRATSGDFTGSPWMRISPASGRSRPMMCRSKTLLPLPLGPMMTKISPDRLCN